MHNGQDTAPQNERLIRARVEDGVIVPDEPLNLPSGTELQLRVDVQVVVSAAETDAGAAPAVQSEPVAVPETPPPETAAAPPAAALPHQRLTQRATWLVVLRLLAACGLALLAQYMLTQEYVWGAVLFFIGAAALVMVDVPPVPLLRARLPTLRTPRLLPADWRYLAMAAAVAMSIGAFYTNINNRYTPLGVTLWLGSLVCWWVAFADMRPGQWWTTPRRAAQQAWRRVRGAPIIIALLLGLLLIGAAFRFALLDVNPYDMNSDQVEKLLDVRDVLSGDPYVFFERNTGREPWQFYWTAALVQMFDLPLSFLTLKIGTALIGFLMLPAVFLIAYEVFGTRTALLALLFAAVTFWAVIPARFGLRYPLAPCAVAWTVAFLITGLKHGNRNAMLGAGLWAGIGMQGYTAYRLMVIVVPLIVAAWAIWLLVQRERGRVLRAVQDGFIALGFTVLTMVPLLRYGLENPEMLMHRAATRLTDAERSIEGDTFMILLDNIRRVLLSFHYVDDLVWVVSVPGEMMLDKVLGALLVVGIAGVVLLSVRRRDPWPLIVLGAGILMLMSSALSIAFPGENPSTVRTGGAIPMLIIVCAVVPGMLLDTLRHVTRPVLQTVTLSGVAALCVGAVYLNYDQVFRAYPESYCPRVSNARDMAAVAEEHLRAGYPPENLWLVANPDFWFVDKRAVGIWLGSFEIPHVVIGAEEAETIDLHGEPGTFLLSAEDPATLALLRDEYPSGEAFFFGASQCPEVDSKHFVMYMTDPPFVE
jgi:hypothetical protein